MVLLTFIWKCFQDRNFHGVVVGLYEQSIESWVGLVYTVNYFILNIIANSFQIINFKTKVCTLSWV